MGLLRVLRSPACMLRGLLLLPRLLEGWRPCDDCRDVLGLLLGLDLSAVGEPYDERMYTALQPVAQQGLHRRHGVALGGHADQSCAALARGVALVQHAAHGDIAIGGEQLAEFIFSKADGKVLRGSRPRQQRQEYNG